MLKSHGEHREYSRVADVAIIMLFGIFFYGLVKFGTEWRLEFQPQTNIDLSLWSLPNYALFSALRACVAYALSFIFTLIVGYCAAKYRYAEKIIIPCLDILQSIPVLGFLPGLVLGFVALFPHTNTGLELAAIVMIFTGQVWNMTFSFYASLKSIPKELHEATQIMGFSAWKTFIKLELPFSSVNLAWNSLMSMAGGWFFLSVCEAFTLGENEFRLPGLGSYMAVAMREGDDIAMICGVLSMIIVIVGMDIIIWRPVLAWVHKFRLEDVPGTQTSEPIMKLMLKKSYVYRILSVLRHKFIHRWQMRSFPITTGWPGFKWPMRLGSYSQGVILAFALLIAIIVDLMAKPLVMLVTKPFVNVFFMYLQVSQQEWLAIFQAALYTLLRVFITLILSTLWAVPVGIYIGMSEKRVRIAQPIVQVLASFPAPMLYPLALVLFFKMGFSFDVASMFLMMLGVQWYILFNVLAGAMRIPEELLCMTNLFQVSRVKCWSKLYIPCVFPALVTGWVTAAGGAWNASIVAEFLSYRGEVLQTKGLGALISVAASKANFPILVASISVMVVMVILLNRMVWARVYKLSTTRFRMDI